MPLTQYRIDRDGADRVDAARNLERLFDLDRDVAYHLYLVGLADAYCSISPSASRIVPSTCA